MSKKETKTTENVAVEQEAEVIEPQTQSRKATESVYSVEELINAHKEFNASKAIVTVALRQAGIETATLEEAKAIIDDFKKKEVR